MTALLVGVACVSVMIAWILAVYWILAPWVYGFKAFTSPKRAATDPTRRRR